MQYLPHFMKSTAVFACLLVVGALFPVACRQSGVDDSVDPTQKPAAFSRLFSKHCSGCHGAEGKLGPAPPLNDPLFVAIIPEEELTRVIRQGRPSSLMPAFNEEQGGELTVEQIKTLVSGIRSRWGPPSAQEYAGAPAYQLELPNSAEKRKEYANQGQKWFAQICARCHGKNGEGNDAGALRSPPFLALISDQALRRIVITGRPDLGMPDYVGLGRKRKSRKPLNSQEITEIVSLLVSWRERTEPVGNLSPKMQEKKP
jgi:cytochrome c oxidase cbb3-type subunit 3